MYYVNISIGMNLGSYIVEQEVSNIRYHINNFNGM